MGNAARKARKRAGIPFTKPAKKKKKTLGRDARGLGFVSRAEILAAILTRRST